MNETMKNAQRDALVAETLGEALKLRDEVAKIGTEISLIPSNLKNVFEEAKGQITEHIEAEVNTSVADMKKRFTDAITDTAKTEAENAIEPIKQAAMLEARRLEKVGRDLAATTWPIKRLLKWAVGLVIGSSVLSTTLVTIVMLSGAGMSLSKDEKRQLEKGQQIEAVWDDLDKRTQDRLTAAIQEQAKH